MQPVEIAGRLLAGLALILANGFFVAIEFALTRARQYAESEFDEPRLRRAWEMTDDLEIYLTSCQVARRGRRRHPGPDGRRGRRGVAGAIVAACRR